MSENLLFSPSNLLARIEVLKKWQEEQQQRLLENKKQNSLPSEQKRITETTYPKCKNREISVEENSGENELSVNSSVNDSYEESFNENIPNFQCQINPNSIDELPVNTSGKEFHMLLEEKLSVAGTSVLQKPDSKPKRTFLKKGSGLSRFRMTINDLAHKKTSTKSTIKTNNDNVNKAKSAPELKSKVKVIKAFKPKQTNIVDNTLTSTPNKKVYKEPKLLWKSSPKVAITSEKEKPDGSTTYQSILSELLELRQKNALLFTNHSSENTLLSENATSTKNDRDLTDELKLFETMEQKVSNSSFCSTSSLVTRFMERSLKSTPQKKLSLLFESMSNDPMISEEMNQLMNVAEQNDNCFEKTEEETLQDIYEETVIEQSNDSDDIEEDDIDNDNIDINDETNSSVNSDDISDKMHTLTNNAQKEQNYVNAKISTKMYKDVGINTDIISQINSELLKDRLEQLEKEISTFRSENVRVNKMKTRYEHDLQNLEKRKKKLEKEIDEQRKQLKQQFDDEKMKLSKERQIYDRYAREIKEGKTLRQKDREELTVLRSQLANLQEEVKLKESKWSATQARLRNQLRTLEKENVALKTENSELRSKNGKLDATNKQLLARKPTDTKVLHEINKNLSKLTKETHAKQLLKSKSESTLKLTGTDDTNNHHRHNNSQSSGHSKPYNRAHSLNDSVNSKSSDNEPEFNKENNNNSNYNDNNNRFNNTQNNGAGDANKSSLERSFDSIEREYDKIFAENKNNTSIELPQAEASTYSEISGFRDEKIMEDGSTRIVYPNGNTKTISPDGKKITMRYHNGDIKETCKETGTIRYLYSDAKTWHTTYPNGLELLEFSNGQVEKRYANGSSEITFPNGCRRCTSPDGTEEVTFPDGTILTTYPSTGEKILKLPNGEREVHTSEHKRREYPDGTVKLLYPDGIQETRYANGRIRLKDKDGNLIMDSAVI